MSTTLRKKNISLQPGFTLMELLIVFALMSMLTVAGVSSFLSYGKTQSLQTSVSDVVAELNLARSRAINQVKPVQCATNTLEGYLFYLNIAAGRYELLVRCGADYSLEKKFLPANISFTSDSMTSVLFSVSTGSPQWKYTTKVTGYGNTKIITVDNSGVISVQ